MINIDVVNVNEAFYHGLDLLSHYYKYTGVRETRNGPAIVCPEPVVTKYLCPRQRVLLSHGRDANPFFHLYESLWMLAGRDDLKPLTEYVKRFSGFSDDGYTLNGAYGHRWRYHFGKDQLQECIDLLRKNPYDRRVVLQMWDPADLGSSSKDVPCNMSVAFSVRKQGELSMTVYNRSNDVIWGAYGANAVHMSILQEYVASSLGMECGPYWQVSNDWHAYLDTFKVTVVACAQELLDWQSGEVPPPYPQMFSLMSTPQEVWDISLHRFMNGARPHEEDDPFFTYVARPMHEAHKAWKDKGLTRAKAFDAATKRLADCRAEDWREAGMHWLSKRYIGTVNQQDSGVAGVP